MGKMNGSFSCLVGMLSPKVISETIFKEMWLIWRRAGNFRPFSWLSPFPFLGGGGEIYSLWRSAVMASLSCGQTYLYEKRFYDMILIRTTQRNFLQLGSDFIMATFYSNTWNWEVLGIKWCQCLSLSLSQEIHENIEEIACCIN